jgi:hypothetical protein
MELRTRIRAVLLEAHLGGNDDHEADTPHSGWLQRL